MITNEQIHERLVEAIKQSGLSQTTIGKALNIKQPTVAQYISGRAFPTLETFANLIKLLDLDANYILCQD